MNTAINYSRISTERLLLRRPNNSDLEALHFIHGDPKTNTFNPTGPHTSLEQSKATLEDWLTLWDEYGFCYWTIENRDSLEILGFGGLSPKEVEGEILPNLYFRFSPAAWGKGYAAEMGKAALEAGCTLLGYERIMASVRPNNAPSIRLLERLGLKRYGEARDEHGLSHLL